MSQLQSYIGQLGNVIQKVLGQFIARLKDLLAEFLARLEFRKACISLKIHQGQIVKVKRSHITIFTLAGAVQQGEDQINIELRRRLNRLIQSFGIDHGLLKIEVEDGTMTEILLGLANRVKNL